MVKNNTYIAELKKTLEESVKNKSIDKTLYTYSILDEMGQWFTLSLAARWSVNTLVDRCVIQMIDDWLDKAGSNGPVKANNEDYTVAVKIFEFKFLQGKELAFDRIRCRPLKVVRSAISNYYCIHVPDYN